MCPQAFLGVLYACSNGSFTELKKKIMELCFVCAGWCFLLLFMHFFHLIVCFGFVFFRFKPIRQPSYADNKILDKVIEMGKGQKVNAK